MSTEKFRVLIVDDIAETRENVRLLLQFESSVEVIGMARNGREGIQLALDLDPDVILMDINMPDIDGITATENIRRKSPHIQVVILSVQGDQNYMRRAFLAGARDFLTKPPMGDELVSAICRAGEMARNEKIKKARMEAPDDRELRLSLELEETELRLTAFDLDSRLDLYKSSIIDGKLVDEIEVLVAGLAHDIRSPLDIIFSNLNTINPNDADTKNALRKIWRRSIYCKWVADNFLGISLSEKISVGKYSLKSIVMEVLELLDNLVRHGIELVNEVEDQYAFVDPSLLRLVLLNLVTNALESMQGTGKIIVRNNRLRDQLAIFVEDDGLPIPSENINKLFTLGFTTKKSHIGVGLYVSKRLLRQQYGDLQFARDFHTNTKIFSVLLPNRALTFYDPANPQKIRERISELKEAIKELQQELDIQRNKDLSDSEWEELSRKFQDITSLFSKNLNNELLLIEATALEATKKLPSEDESTRNVLNKIVRNCEYCRLLTSNIQALGEGDSLNLEEVSIVNVVDEVLSLIDRKMPSHLYKVDWEADFFVPTVKADSLKIKQVFMNLIKNALDAMQNGGTLKLTVTSDDSFVIAEVGDTGVGIASENMSRLFQLGFTTKTRGYGIGLYSIKKIIEKHKGDIEVSSTLGKGTVFKIKLPLHVVEAK